MSVEFDFKPKYDVNDLLSIMKILRSENGCPWDREQDHKSIRNNFIEETYEAVEAIDTDDSELLLEELGDVLLQVVFHSQIENEQGGFDFSDVADGICKKLIVRHPHVFGDLSVNNSDDVLQNWEKIKNAKKGHKKTSENLLGVSVALPALMRSAKVQQRASNGGFDWDDIKGPFDKIDEEIEELKEAVDSKNHEAIEDELGDLLFSAVNLSRFVKVNPEEALTASCNKFIDRFIKVEKLAEERGLNMQTASIDELDKLWEEVKR